MTVQEILSLSQAGFTPDQIAALAPLMTQQAVQGTDAADSSNVPVPAPVPAPEPAPEPELTPMPNEDEKMPAWAKTLVSALQQAAISNSIIQNAPKSIEDQANDALASIISPYNPNGGKV